MALAGTPGSGCEPPGLASPEKVLILEASPLRSLASKILNFPSDLVSAIFGDPLSRPLL